MRVLLCDDDGLLRAVLTSQVEDHGHEVVAEADMALAATQLLERLHPDLVIVDLAMPYGSGEEVVDAATAQGCAVIVFTSYVRSVPGVDAVVSKPDFAALDAAIAAVEARGARGGGDHQQGPGSVERRRAPGALSGGQARKGASTANELYAALATAAPGDVLVRVCAEGDEDATADGDLAELARSVTRAQDLVAPVRGGVFLVLVTGDEAGATAVRDRLGRAWRATGAAGSLRMWHEVIPVDGSPSDVFARLRDLEVDAADPA